ncbi:MAG TPA: methyltransferase domain-containing protein [Anaeromyxobacteraceae bacterium]|nr:methyltransferase domain-containing protein [Anaeromyxobacteraceae bacterium]
MVNFYARNGAGDLLARYSFIEPLLTGRRVLEVGAAAATEGATALFLAERGAAAVLSVDEPSEALDAAREAARHPFVQVRPGRAEELPRGAFDIVLVTDGTTLAADPARVSALKGLLARGGYLVAAIPVAGTAGLSDLAGEPPAPEPPAYETFVGSLGDQFPIVEVATQSPTVGWVVAMSSGEEEPEISIDGGLAGDPEAAYYVAVCGDAPSGLAGLTVVALPPRPLLDTVRERLGEGDVRERLEALRAAAERAPQLEAELEAERESAFELRAEVDRREAAAQAAAAELEQRKAAAAEVEAALQGARSESQAARSALDAALERAVAAEGRVAELEESLEARGRAASSLEEELARAREEAGEARVEADLARGEAEQMREAAARAEAGTAGNAERSAALEAEIEALRHEREAALGERAAAEAERDGLRAELEAERAAGDGAKPEEAQRLASEVARLEEAAAEATSVREALEAQLAEMAARVEAEEERRRMAEAREAEARALHEQAAEATAVTDRSDEIAALRRQVEEYARAVSASEMALLAARNAAEAAQAQAAELEAELQAIRWEKDEIEQRLEAAQQVGAIGSAGEVARLREELGQKGSELEELRAKVARLEAAPEARPAGLPDAAAPEAAAGPPAGEAQAREREALQAALAERDGRIQRLQREVADKTERLGRLAREVGELKARVLR